MKRLLIMVLVGLANDAILDFELELDALEGAESLSARRVRRE